MAFFYILYFSKVLRKPIFFIILSTFYSILYYTLSIVSFYILYVFSRSVYFVLEHSPQMSQLQLFPFLYFLLSVEGVASGIPAYYFLPFSRSPAFAAQLECCWLRNRPAGPTSSSPNQTRAWPASIALSLSLTLALSLSLTLALSLSLSLTLYRLLPLFPYIAYSHSPSLPPSILSHAMLNVLPDLWKDSIDRLALTG